MLSERYALKQTNNFLKGRGYLRQCYSHTILVIHPSNFIHMANAMTAVGLGLAAASFTGRYILHRFPSISVQTSSLFKTLSSWESILNSSKFYKGGFDPKMSKREASLILGVSQNASKPIIKQAHKRLITINHPDRGGSPFIAAKVNEAKDYLQNSK